MASKKKKKKVVKKQSASDKALASAKATLAKAKGMTLDKPKTSSSTPKTTSGVSSSGGSSVSNQLKSIQEQALKIQNELNKSVASGQIQSSAPKTTVTPTTSAPSTDLKNLSIGLAGGTGGAVQTSAGQETPQQTVARVSRQSGNAVIPSQGTSPDLTNLSVGLVQGQQQSGQSPEDWARAFMEQMQGQNPDTSGVGTQSTQGDASAGVQPGVNDAMAGVAGATGGMDFMGSIGGTPGTSVPQGPMGASGAGPVTGATGGYVKVGPAYFEKYSDGLRAVSDPTVISGLKHGTIPYATQGLDGTTFSKYSVPLVDPTKQAVADANLRAMGLPAEGDMVDQGAGLLNTYQNYQQKYGLSQTQTDYFNDPMKTVREITSQIFEMSGVSDANDMIKDITGDLEDLENERDGKIADINDNPWLTEGVRLRQIASVEARYEDKIANHTNRLRLLEDVRNNAQQQAQFAVGTAISLWDKERTFQQHQIDSWNEQAQNQIDNTFKAAQLDLAMRNSGTSTMQEYLFAKENGFQGDIIDYQRAVSTATRAPSDGGFLTPAQMNATINQITGAFDNEPIVREYNTITAGLNFIRSLGTSPTDDQARIYQFAKIMDPNSAVREGEYATVQEYSTALLQRFGLQAQRVFTNSGILTPEARNFLLTTLEKRHAVSQGQYDNLYQQYQGRIQNVMNGGLNTLPQYAYTQPSIGTSFPGIQQVPGTQTMAPTTQAPQYTLPGGQTVTRIQ